VAARLDLAQRYADAGRTDAAAEQYLVAVRLDPTNVEANAALGFILYQAGKPDEGLRAVQAALKVDATNPEALYEEGIILWSGLHRYTEARSAFRAYLAAAPFGAHRDEVQGYLERSTPSGG
jgi:tetratricopeptide (TPR) repeat protein